ncbi:MAG: 30S ribosomal protein S9, partial [Alphaproteobacteria bacterium]|nr:30S ribosomal protein S9 [Alphaproteobacteria bacterium]
MATKTTLSDLKDAVAEKENEEKEAGEGKTEAAGSGDAVVAKPKLDAKGRAYGTGRRKDAVARVWLARGSGKITNNGKDIGQYFARGTQRLTINPALEVAQR